MIGEMTLVSNSDEQFEKLDVNLGGEFSGSIGKITEALSTAQGDLTSVSKGEQGFGYKYSSLASTIDLARPVLKKYGLNVVQLVGNASNGNPQITTILSHTSGEYFRSVASLPLIEMKGVNKAQIMGAVYSYLRRYALQAILNLASEDNDASSKGLSKPSNKTTATAKPKAEASSSGTRQKFRKKNEF